MGKERYAKEPLLYIHQEKRQTPIAPMQQDYYTDHNKKQNNISKKKIPSESQKRTRPLRRTFLTEENEHESSQVEELDKQEVQEKSFKEMDIEERVHYFVSRPSHAPQLKCEVQTNEKTFRGVITGYEEKIVFVQVGKRSTSIKLELSEIISIRLLGF